MFSHDDQQSIQFPIWLSKPMIIKKTSQQSVGAAHAGQKDFEAILHKVSDYFSISSDVLAGRRKVASLVFPWAVLFFLCLQYTEHSLRKIGQFFSNRGPQTIKKSCLWLQQYYADHPAVKFVIKDISRTYIADYKT